jgi:hypothetical protein
MPWRNLALGAAAAAHLTCHQVILSAPPGSAISLFANPPFIEANGGVSVISALVIEPLGTPVADGTVVQFFTTLGRIDEQAKTNDGVARVNLVSDSRSGIAVVTAVSGAPGGGSGPTPSPSPTAAPVPEPGGTGTGSVSVTIGNVRAETIRVTADPSSIQPDAPRESVISAFVTDVFGNPVANLPLIFEIVPPVTTERLEGEGQPIFTDNNGRAQDVLRTHYPLDGPQKEVTVRVTLSTGESADVVVTINPSAIPSPTPPPTPPTTLTAAPTGPAR